MRLVCGMIVHNESNRYLEEVIENNLKFCDLICVLDDHSTDNTIEICKQYGDKVVVKSAVNDWSCEWKLRDELLNWMLTYSPTHVFMCDADEIYEAQKFIKDLQIIEQYNIDVVGFRFYDIWKKADANLYYRFDKFYQCGTYHWERMFKVNPNVKYVWRESNRHCGSIPMNAICGYKYEAESRVAHFGWFKEEDRIRKAKERQEEDKGQYFPKELYEAILDKNPNLVKF